MVLRVKSVGARQALPFLQSLPSLRPQQSSPQPPIIIAELGQCVAKRGRFVAEQGQYVAKGQGRPCPYGLFFHYFHYFHFYVSRNNF
jgi:hypothetical protein